MSLIRSHPLLVAAAAGLAVSSMGMYVWHEESRPKILEVYMMHMKGSAVLLIRTPEDKRVLINGGANADVIRDITKVLPFYSRRIDMVIATKDDTDHVSGLIDVVSRYSVSQAGIPAVTLNLIDLSSTADAAYQTFLDRLNGLKIEPETMKAGDSIPLDPSTRLEVLFPAATSEFVYSKASAPEVLFRVTYKDTSIVFMGDATPKIQKTIASRMATSSDKTILLIPQSIAQGNITPQLLQKVNPEALIYSQAIPKKPSKTRPNLSFQNKYNLQEGNLKVVSDGSDIRIEPI